MAPMSLPRGLTTRPLHLSDASAVTAVMAADQLAVLGRVVIEEADIVGDWQRPSHDVAAGTIGVFDGDRLVGYAEAGRSGRGDAAVLPEYHDQGIGRWLAGWMVQRAGEQGQQVIGMPVPSGSPGERLLRELGWKARWTSWVLVFPEGRSVEERPLPEGYRMRVAEEDADRRGAWDVIEDAFLEWSEREKESFADWSAGVMGRPGFEPWNLRVVLDPAGEVVGGVFVLLSEGTGYVDKLAVRKDQRRRGLARALLADAFRVAREHGASRSELATDSRTGALDLYLGLGMEIEEEWVNLGREP
jgi:mycothiol synthase